MSEKILVCSNCKDSETCCSYCGTEPKIGDNFECHDEGANHFCEADCMTNYFGEDCEIVKLVTQQGDD